MAEGKSKDPVKVAAGKMGGRPVTVQGGERVTVRLSPELYDELQAMRAKVRARGRELSTSEAVRWLVKFAVDSPGDLVRAIIEDPNAQQTQAIERSSTKSRRPRAGAAGPARGPRGRRGGEAAASA